MMDSLDDQRSLIFPRSHSHLVMRAMHEDGDAEDNCMNMEPQPHMEYWNEELCTVDPRLTSPGRLHLPMV